MRKKWISPSRYVAILFILRLWEVRESDDFVTKYDIYTTVCVKEWDICTNTARKEVCSFLYPSPWVYVWIAYKILIWNTWYMMHVLAWTFLSLYVLFFFWGGGVVGYLSLLTCLYVSPLPVKHGGYSFYRGLPVILSPLRFPYFFLYGSANWFQTFWVAS